MVVHLVVCFPPGPGSPNPEDLPNRCPFDAPPSVSVTHNREQTGLAFPCEAFRILSARPATRLLPPAFTTSARTQRSFAALCRCHDAAYQRRPRYPPP